MNQIILYVGLACLHCLSPQADASARSILETLNQAKRPVATNLLLEGFGYTYDRFTNLVSYLRPGDFLLLYVHNGSWQRKCSKLPSLCTAWIHENPDQYLEYYRDYLRAIVPAIVFAQSRGIVVGIAPTLEDNLTDEEFRSVAVVTEWELSKLPAPVLYIRSSIVSHWTPPGWLFDSHHSCSAVSTNDGKPKTFSQARKLRDKSAIFIYWDNKRQGSPIGRTVHPSKRKYALITEKDRPAYLNFLEGK